MIALLAWRSRQPAGIRWGFAGLIVVLAVLGRMALGRLHGANPALVFYPAILIATTCLGWVEASGVLIASVAIGSYLFVGAGLYLQPVAWFVVGALNILIIATLKAVAQQLHEANKQQKILFQELQHRVANTLQAAGGSIERARKQLTTEPMQAAAVLDEASRRVWAAADVHRRMNDPDMVRTAFKSILYDAVASVIDPRRVILTLDIDQPDLSLDQMSTITMIIIECAYNAQKHVFEPGLGSTFSVTLMGPRPDLGMLIVRDDGPGMVPESSFTAPLAGTITLGRKLVQRLAAHLGATVTITSGAAAGTVSGAGTEIVIAFPLDPTRDDLVR